MAFDERLKRTAQGQSIGFGFYPERGSDVVSRAFRRELLEKPESLLSVRQRECGFTHRGSFGNLRRRRRRFNQLEAARGDLCDALTTDGVRHRQEHTKLRLDAVRQLNC